MEQPPLTEKILRIFFPPICVSCKKRISNGVLCSACKSSIQIRSGFICPKCSRRLPETENTCHWDRFPLAAASSYKIPAVRGLIHALKYRRAKNVLGEISEVIERYLKESFNGEIRDSLIVPIPLHRRKERERGFNQAEFIAEILKNKLGGKIQKDNLVRIRKTNPQIKTRNYKERAKNVAGCFDLQNPEFITKKKIILVDDVFTSGATMNEAVKVLKKGGANKIIGFVVAKA